MQSLLVLRHAMVTMLLAGAGRCTATILFKTGSNQYSQLADLPAKFGPRVPTKGSGGLLVAAEPSDGCRSLHAPPESVAGQLWIALISRSHASNSSCTFDVKVRNAQSAGASAAIVYDNVEGPLVLMAKPENHPEPIIPSAFVTRRSGIEMLRLLIPGVTVVIIMPAGVEVWLPLLMSAFSALIAITILLATFYGMRYLRLRRLAQNGGLAAALLQPEGEEGLSAEQLRALPLLIHESHRPRHGTGESTSREGSAGDSNGQRGVYTAAPSGASHPNSSNKVLNSTAVGNIHDTGEQLPPRSISSSTLGSSSSSSSSRRGIKGGGTLKTCVICIEDYEDGDKLRALPCSHRFHKDCIDQWLSARPPLCPVCKWDAAEPFPDTPEAAAAAATAEEALSSRGLGFRSWQSWLPWRWFRGAGSDEVPAVTAPSITPASAAVHRHDIESGLAGGASQGLQTGHTPRNFPSLLSATADDDRVEREPEGGDRGANDDNMRPEQHTSSSSRPLVVSSSASTDVATRGRSSSVP